MKTLTQFLTRMILPAVLFTLAACGDPKPVTPPDDNGNDKPDPNAPFAISISDIKTTSATMTVTPKDDNATYLPFMGEKAAYKDNKTIIAEQIEFLNKLAQANKKTLQEILKMYLKTGKQTLPISGCTPNTEYYAYAVAMDNDGNATSDVIKASFKTASVATQDIKFNIKVTETTETSATIVITPDNNDCYYYSEVLPKDFIEAEPYNGDVALYFEILSEYIYLQEGVTGAALLNKFIKSGNVTKGVRNFTHKLETGVTEYVVYALGVNEECVTNSQPTKFTFTAK